MTPERAIRYVDSGGLQIAYQVEGNGPLDIVVAFDWASNSDLPRELPPTDRSLRRFFEFDV